MANALSWVGPLSLGAVAMYLLDPSTGRRRRALVRDQAVHLSRRTSEAADALARDLRNRATGLAATLRRDAEDVGPVDDAVLEARVRSSLGRVCSHPGAVGVSSVQGIVELVGPVLADEYEQIWNTVNAVPGVLEVVDNLVVHERGDNVPGLQGEGSLPRQNSLSPTVRMLAVLGGAGLIAYGVRERTVIGGIAAAAGAGLVARGFGDRTLGSVLEQLRLPAADEMDMDAPVDDGEWPQPRIDRRMGGDVGQGAFGPGTGPAVL
jgi:hypothetical protein